MNEDNSLPEYLVAYVDLLGFRNEVENIRDNHDFQEVLQKMKIVHDEFGINPKDKYKINERRLGERYVLSLSDSVIIATALNSRTAETIGSLDNWGDEVCTIGINQAICAAKGIFLRGGISKGQFHFENDILISQAMISAYEIEKNVSTYPIICLDDSTYKWFESHKDNNCYAEYIKLKNILFIEFQISNEKKVFGIDYMAIMIKYTLEGQDLIFIREHKLAITNELKKNHKCDIMCKFLWLRRYHNDTVNKVFPHHKELLIL